MQDLAPVLQPLLAALFTAFDKPDSAENEYVMRCIMRVIGFVGPEVTPDWWLVLTGCIDYLFLFDNDEAILCTLLSIDIWGASDVGPHRKCNVTSAKGLSLLS